MSPVQIVRTESLGGSPLARAARQGQLPQWYRSMPRTPAEWRAYAESVAASVPAGWLDRLRPAIAPTGAAAARLDRSADGQGIVITTGQQPGLFGGPLMTLAKAISARSLADELQSRLGIPVAPVFWAATDDADFDEASVVSVALDGGARELRLEATAPAGTPMARVPLDENVERFAATLREACGSTPHLAILEAALAAYRGGSTVGGAYVALLRHILEPLEIAVFDVSHPCVAIAAAPLMDRAASNAAALASAIRTRNASIIAAGFEPQVEEVAGLSLVFLNSDGVKRRLPIDEAGRMSPLDEHQYLSSTVLLRPVLERAILPTAAYVAGPGETAYFAQTSVVADALGVPIPLVFPRWSTTIVEPRIQRQLDAFSLAPDDFADPHAADTAVARAALPVDVTRSLNMLRENIDADLDALAAANGELVPQSVVDGLRRSLEHQVARAERRLIAGVKRRETEAMRKLATLRGVLYPHGVRQERKLSYVPFLARGGPALVAAMLEAAAAHARLTLSTGTPSTSRDSIPIAR
jgi:bacillithiol synthase